MSIRLIGVAFTGRREMSQDLGWSRIQDDKDVEAGDDVLAVDDDPLTPTSSSPIKVTFGAFLFVERKCERQ